MLGLAEIAGPRMGWLYRNGLDHYTAVLCSALGMGWITLPISATSGTVCTRSLCPFLSTTSPHAMTTLQKAPYRDQYLCLICWLASECKWCITCNKWSEQHEVYTEAFCFIYQYISLAVFTWMHVFFIKMMLCMSHRLSRLLFDNHKKERLDILWI